MPKSDEEIVRNLRADAEFLFNEDGFHFQSIAQNLYEAAVRIEELEKMAYLTIRVPKFLRKRSNV